MNHLPYSFTFTAHAMTLEFTFIEMKVIPIALFSLGLLSLPVPYWNNLVKKKPGIQFEYQLQVKKTLLSPYHPTRQSVRVPSQRVDITVPGQRPITPSATYHLAKESGGSATDRL